MGNIFKYNKQEVLGYLHFFLFEALNTNGKKHTSTILEASFKRQVYFECALGSNLGGFS